MEKFGKFMVIVMAMIISPIISGFVIVKLWAWFIVPTFQANPLRIVEAIGIMLLINCLKAKRDKGADKDKFWTEFTNNIVFLILMAAFALFSGWIIQMFM